MKVPTLAVIILLLASGRIGRAQVQDDVPSCSQAREITQSVQSTADQTKDSMAFAKNFPKLNVLEASLMESVCMQSAAEIESSAGNNSSLRTGRWAALNSLFVDNMKLDVQGAYSDTLQRTVESDGQLTAFQLSGVKFVPTYSLTYELNLGQLTKAKRGWRSASKARRDQITAFDKALPALFSAYVQFEASRADFLSQKDQSARSASFYKVKAAAVTALGAAHYSERTEEAWALAEYAAPQGQEKAPVQTAMLKK